MKKVFGSVPIYWINLDSSIDRKEHMERQLNGLNHMRIPAIDGIDSSAAEKYKIINPNPFFSRPLNSVICSHIKAVQKAYDNNLPYVIVLEDKCNFDYIQHFNHTINEIMEIAYQKFPEWEIIQLTSCPLYDLNDYLSNGLTVYKWNGHSFMDYLINRDGMKKILKLINYNGINTFNLSNVNKCVDPEDVFYSNLNSLILNFPILYVYFGTTTFSYYFSNMDPEPKYHALTEQTNIKNKILSFVNQHFVKK